LSHNEGQNYFQLYDQITNVGITLKGTFAASRTVNCTINQRSYVKLCQPTISDRAKLEMSNHR